MEGWGESVCLRRWIGSGQAGRQALLSSSLSYTPALTSPPPSPPTTADRDLDGFIPKSAKDFEELGQIIAARYFQPHFRGNAAQYKAGVKSLLHHVLRPLSAGEVKDVETAVAGVRADKLKEEKAAVGGKKTMKKANLNLGKGGGSAGLDDYKYDAPLDDDFDFM